MDSKLLWATGHFVQYAFNIWNIIIRNLRTVKNKERCLHKKWFVFSANPCHYWDVPQHLACSETIWEFPSEIWKYVKPVSISQCYSDVWSLKQKSEQLFGMHKTGLSLKRNLHSMHKVRKLNCAPMYVSRYNSTANWKYTKNMHCRFVVVYVVYDMKMKCRDNYEN